MVRTPSYDKSGLKKGTWTPEEDRKLIAYVTRYGCWNWRQLPRFAGLERCGKSCRLRWMNYLRPNIKRGNYTPQEEDLIIKLHKDLGNKWSAIAAHLPGRTDNEIKNHWHTSLKKRSQHNSLTPSHHKSKKSSNLTSTISSSPSSSIQQTERLDSGPLSPQSYSSSTNSSVHDDLSFIDAINEPGKTQDFWAHLNLDDIFCNPTQAMPHAPPQTPSIPHNALVEDDFAFLDSFSVPPFESYLMETQVDDVSYTLTQLQASSLGDELDYLYPLYDIDLWGQST